MDARITKQRLGNLLSYDWLKILVSVVAAVVALVVFFTMVGTRPTSAQTFTVFCHEELNAGADFNTLENSLKNKEVFSYDILSVGTEKFSKNSSSNAAYSARRAVGTGNVYFVPDKEPKYNEIDGKKVLDESSNELISLSSGVVYNGENKGGFYDTAYFLEECENYLAQFFDENGETDTAVVRECFLSRNGKDKRFRSKAKKEEGVKSERARIEKLRKDYLFVKAAFEAETLTYITYENAEGVAYNFGISLTKLTGLGNLVNYGTEGSAPVALMILRNNYKDNNLRFETVSFIKYLVKEYGPNE